MREPERTSKVASMNPLKLANNRKQFSSFVLFLSVIIIVNLCPFQPDIETCYPTNDSRNNEQQCSQQQNEAETFLALFSSSINKIGETKTFTYRHHMNNCFKFIRLMFTNPLRLGKRATRFTVADAKVLGKMAKMWYIKKKIKKLSKKLKKHTIAVPVFTAIPIYEHSY